MTKRYKVLCHVSVGPVLRVTVLFGQGSDGDAADKAAGGAGNDAPKPKKNKRKGSKGKQRTAHTRRNLLPKSSPLYQQLQVAVLINHVVSVLLVFEARLLAWDVNAPITTSALAAALLAFLRGGNKCKMAFTDVAGGVLCRGSKSAGATVWPGKTAKEVEAKLKELRATNPPNMAAFDVVIGNVAKELFKRIELMQVVPARSQLCSLVILGLRELCDVPGVSDATLLKASGLRKQVEKVLEVEQSAQPGVPADDDDADVGVDLLY